MITMGQKWMSALVGWIPGLKHYATPLIVHHNCREYDQVRRVLLARCKNCDATISRDEKAQRELVYNCGKCEECKKSRQVKSHTVCLLCYDMFHALYLNYTLKNARYFHDLDEQDKARRDADNSNKRDRLGL
jgi:hypothetical protein